MENSLALILDRVNQGACSLNQVVHWMCEEPARVWNIRNKGQIEVGFDADLTLVDLAMPHPVDNQHQQTKCKWSPWHGAELLGTVRRTWVKGTEVFRKESDGREWYSPQQNVGDEIEYTELGRFRDD